MEEDFIVSVFIALFICSEQRMAPDNVVIGGLIDGRAETEGVLHMAVDYVNKRDDLLSDTNLSLATIRVEYPLDQMLHIQAMCSIMKDKPAVVIGPFTSTSVKITHPIPASQNIPMVAPYATDPLLSSRPMYNYLLKMTPSDTKQAQALIEIVRRFGWRHLAILHDDTDYGRNGMAEFARLVVGNGWSVDRMEEFHADSDPAQVNATHLLSRIKSSGTRVILLHTLESYALVILCQAQCMGMLEEGWAWLVTDGLTEDTYLNTASAKHNYSRDCLFTGILGTRPSTSRTNMTEIAIGLLQENNVIQPTCSQTATDCSHLLRLFDAVLAVAYALHDYIEDDEYWEPPLADPNVCLHHNNSIWPSGHMFNYYLSQVQGLGATGYLNFTASSNTGANGFDVVNFREGQWMKVGEWREGGLLLQDEPVFPGGSAAIPPDTRSDLYGVHLKMATIMERPFVMASEASNETMIGLCLDMMALIAGRLGFTWEYYLVEDKAYGVYDPSTNSWSGIIGDVIEGKADLGLAPLSITRLREKYVDMTTPYMDLGLDILMSKPSDSAGLFEFFEPFDPLLWVSLLCATYICGFGVAFCGYCSPYGYRGRYIQRRKLEVCKYKSQKEEMSLNNGIWFSFSSLLKQGPTTTPVSMSGRIIGGTWWAAVTILIAAYTANFTANLTVKRIDSGVKSLGDLVMQSNIDYGTVARSSVQEFFQTSERSPFTEVYKHMVKKDTWVSDSEEGVLRVQRGSIQGNKPYAFIFDSPIIEYSASNPPCTTLPLRKIFRKYGYGLALPMESPYTTLFNDAILWLRDAGEINALELKWVFGPCPGLNTEAISTEEPLSMYKMGGVFILFGGGILVGLLFMVCEFVIASHHDANEDEMEGIHGSTWKKHLKRRLVVTWGDTKVFFHRLMNFQKPTATSDVVCVDCHCDVEPQVTHIEGDVTFGEVLNLKNENGDVTKDTTDKVA